MSDNENKNYPSLEDVAEEIETAAEIETTEEESIPDYSDVPDEDVIKSDVNFDADMWQVPAEPEAPRASGFVKLIYDFLETLVMVTLVILLCFAFIFRLNVVDGPSMEKTLHTGEYLLVSDLFYEATPGDIVVIQDMTAGRYAEPIVKRVIAVEGQTVDIDFTTWTLTVDGEVVDESDYIYLSSGAAHTSDLQYPLTVKEGHIFVMGDNRNHSADSRLAEIGQIDERCVIGKVYARVFPFDSFQIFKNPYND